MTIETFIPILAKSYFIAYTIILVASIFHMFSEDYRKYSEIADMANAKKGKSPYRINVSSFTTFVLYILSMYLK